MKKYLLLSLSLCLTLATIAAPWDIRKQVIKPPLPALSVIYDDPYVTLYQAFESDYGNIKHKLILYAELDQSTPYKYRVTLELSGVWWVGGAGFRYYDLILNIGQWYKFQEFPLYAFDQPAINTPNLYYSGPY